MELELTVLVNPVNINHIFNKIKTKNKILKNKNRIKKKQLFKCKLKYCYS